MQDDREAGDSALGVLRDVEHGAKPLLERVAQPVGKLIDVLGRRSGELRSKQLLHLRQGSAVDGQSVVVDSPDAEHVGSPTPTRGAVEAAEAPARALSRRRSIVSSYSSPARTSAAAKPASGARQGLALTSRIHGAPRSSTRTSTRVPAQPEEVPRLEGESGERPQERGILGGVIE